MPDFSDERDLDNPVWSCLTTRHAHLAVGGAFALRYPAEFSPLGGMPADTPENLRALWALVAAGDDLSVTGATLPAVPANWQTQHQIRIVQMIRRERTTLPESAEETSTLFAADAGDMLALVELTHPGPFRNRTVELGTFIGIRRHGRLLAMAGERMWIGDHREVSGVCTHPDAQGRGFARALVGAAVNRMLRAGQVPFLHVENGNARAISLYESLGFVRRTELALVHAKRMS